MTNDPEAGKVVRMTGSGAKKSKEVKLGRPFGSTSEETRARLLDAAAALFNAHSFGEVSLSRIAKSAGLTGAAIYNHFESKEELFAETVKDRIRKNQKIISKAAGIEGSWKDRLNNILTIIAKIQKAERGFPLITSVAQTRMVREPEKYTDIIELRREYSLIFQSIVADAINAGDLPDTVDVPIAGELLMAFTANSISTVSFYHPSHREIDKIVDAVRALLGIDR